MDLREQLLRHRKDNRFIIAGLTLLLVICGVVFYLLQRGKGLPAQMAANKLLLFVLWYINVILILTIVLVLVRSLFRLLLERRHRILGSKFKTKLVLTAIGLSLIPVLILFPFSMRLLLQSFDQWFSLPIEEIVSQAAETATALMDQIEDTNKRDARRVLAELEGFDLADLAERPELHRRLQELLEESQLHYLAVYDGTELIHGTADPMAGFNRAVHINFLSRFLEEAMEKGEATRVEDPLDIEGQLILAACAEPRNEADAATDPALDEPAAVPSWPVIVAGTVLPPEIAQRSTSLVKWHQSYLQMAVEKEEVRAVYVLNLLMVTLLVILAFSSIGLRLARRLTTPIQALAEGTRRISSGDLDHRVEVAVDDEVGVLVDAFNHMTEELQRNKELVDRSNRELVDANKRLAAVLQNVAAGVVSIDAEGRVVTCNGAALEILNQREEDVVGHSILETWADAERGKLVMLLEEEDVAVGHGRQARMIIGGVWKTLEVKVTTLPDTSQEAGAGGTASHEAASGGTGGQPGGRVVVLEDLTELIYAQKMAAWNEVARQIAHEIKNPLTPIRLTAERLLHKHRQGDPKFGETLEQGAELIVREVSSLKSMVDEFSRFARMPRPQPRQIDLENMTGEILGLYQGLKPGVEVEGAIEPQAASVRFDPEQLKSVLINLLDNAVEATDSPGKVTLSTTQRNGTVLLHVADTGRGIPAEDLNKLFLPYYSTKGRGSGLGLAIVHRIVTDHNAAIHVERNQPKGIVFTLEIPQI